jgi:uncharacterized phage protein gp47/JayE
VPDFGITPTGFVRKTVEDIVGEIADDLRADIAPDIDTSAESLLGQIIAPFATQLGAVWEGLEAAYNGRSRAAAGGAQLVATCALTGTVKRARTKGTVPLRLTVAAMSTVPAGSVAQVDGQPTNRWVTLADAVNATGAPAQRTVDAEAQTAGAVPANASTITVIATPVSGWTAVTNDADATPGLDDETDPQLRARTEASLATGGTSPTDALRAALLDPRTVPGVLQVVVTPNDTDFADDQNRPPHSVECLVLGGDDQVIADAIWANKASGIQAYGSSTWTVLDADGASHVVRFSRPTTRSVHVVIELRRDASTYAGDAAVKSAVQAWHDANLRMGQPVLLARVSSLALAVAGVTNVVRVLLGLAEPPDVGAADLEVGPRDLADLDTANIDVTVLG